MSGNLREILGNGIRLLVDDIQIGLGSRAGGKVYLRMPGEELRLWGRQIRVRKRQKRPLENLVRSRRAKSKKDNSLGEKSVKLRGELLAT